MLEVGCGTAVPTVYLLERLFVNILAREQSQTSESHKGKTVVHLQDYNSEGETLLSSLLDLILD